MIEPLGDQDIGSHQGREGMIEDHLSLEDLLFATLDAVSRFRVGQRDTVSAALEAGPLLTKAKARLHHGEWGDWLHRVGLAPSAASSAVGGEIMVRHLQPLVTGLALAETLDRLVNIVEGLKIDVGPSVEIMVR